MAERQMLPVHTSRIVKAAGTGDGSITGTLSRSVGPRAANDSPDRLPVLDIPDVHAHGIVPGQVGAPADLPQPREPWLDEEAPGPDEGHLASENVEQLRQLVERVPPQNLADAGDAGVVLFLEEDAVSVVSSSSVSTMRSAPVTMLRNPSMEKVRPSRPTRCCRKNTGPRLVTVTASVRHRWTGSRNSTPSPAAALSKRSLVIRRCPVNSGHSMCIRGRPQTGRIRTRVATISVIADARRSSAGVFSRSQPRRRSVGPSSSGQGKTATVSTSKQGDDGSDLIEGPEDGQPVERVGGGAELVRGQAATDDPVPAIRLAL
jgi:hypothetical protein